MPTKTNNEVEEEVARHGSAGKLRFPHMDLEDVMSLGDKLHFTIIN
jgi:hypothetical protein